jgi:hypothetical protein
MDGQNIIRELDIEVVIRKLTSIRNGQILNEDVIIHQYIDLKTIEVEVLKLSGRILMSLREICMRVI